MAFEAGARSYMASLNAWNSVPMAMNPVLDSVVAKEWNVDGIVSTDAEAIAYAVSRHKYFPGSKEVIAASIKLGVNQFLDNYAEPVRDALETDLISESDIDHALRGKFRIVIRLGLLDPPSHAGEVDSTQPEPWISPIDKDVALQIAREGIVLLKNTKGTLPLDRHAIKSIAVYGDHAGKVFEGFCSGEPPYTVTPVEGLQNKLGPNAKISVDHGSFGFGDRFAAARDSDVAIVFVGNDPTCNRAFYFAHFDSDDSWCETPSDGVENSDRRSLELSEEDLIKQVYAANPRTIVVLLADFPYTINWTEDHIPAILTMSQNAQEIGNAIADVLFGDYNPAGHTVVT
jgi:beta-glucosidase